MPRKKKKKKPFKLTDVNMNDTPWSMYLKKYKSKYKVFNHKEDRHTGIWSIKCKYGYIQPYSIIKQQLVGIFECPTLRGINELLKRLNNGKFKDYKITQAGDNDICIMFDEKHLDSLVNILRIRKKKQLSEETKERLRKQLALARARR